MSARYYTSAAQVFADRVRERGDAKAILWSTRDATSYAQLDRSSNQVARWLLEHGVGKRATVCLCLEKTPLAYSSILACLKIGAPSFVVDPASPAARTRLMLECCNPALALLAPSTTREAFDCRVLVADEDGHLPMPRQLSDAPVDNPAVDESDPAYIMFTSGSTGTPKGATISHGNLLNFIFWSQTQFETRVDDIFTNLNPLYFDNSVFDIYASLFSGAALVPFTAATMKNPDEIVSRIDELRCTVYFSVPSLLVYLQTLKLIGKPSFPTLKKMIFGGEGYPKPMLAKLHGSLGDRIELVNVYGPTECTCICSVYQIGAADFVDLNGYAPLGPLIPNFSYVVMAEPGKIAAAGDVGELYLGGPCVGLGYYGRPEQTASAFVQNPAHDRFFERMYKTGDLVRCDADGQLHFVGRADRQVKHQGYRIELGEIEHVLNSIDGVEQAAVIYLSRDGRGRIIAVAASSRQVSSADLREELLKALPKYMMPDRIIVAPQLPTNANGKVDRKAIEASVAAGTL